MVVKGTKKMLILLGGIPSEGYKPSGPGLQGGPPGEQEIGLQELITMLQEDDRRILYSVSDELRKVGFSIAAVDLGAAVEAISTVAIANGRIDAIVLPDSYESVDIAKRIRSLDDRITFKGSVRAKTVPIVFTITGNMLVANRETAEQPDTAGPVEWSRINQGDIALGVIEVIKSWRQSLINELIYVGLVVSIDEDGSVRLGHALRRRHRHGTILADSADRNALKRSQYLILAEDFLQGFRVYDELKYLLAHYEAIAKRQGIKPESVFQSFLQKNPHLVLRDAFGELWAKPKLRFPEAQDKFYVPDFVMKPKIAAHLGTNWEIMDIKLPNDPLLTTGRFHPAFSQKLTRAIQQLRDYRGYFSRTDTREELQARFGYHPRNPRLAVLIGRQHRAAELEVAQGTAALDVSIITYDDLLEFEENKLVLEAGIAGLFTR
jgi:hypothetical protein